MTTCVESHLKFWKIVLVTLRERPGYLNCLLSAFLVNLSSSLPCTFANNNVHKKGLGQDKNKQTVDSCTANPVSAHEQSSWLVNLILTNPPSNSEMPCKHRQKYINSTIRSQQSYPSAMILKTTGGTRIVGWCSFKDNVMTVMSVLADSKIGLTDGKLSTQSSMVVVIPFCWLSWSHLTLHSPC